MKARVRSWSREADPRALAARLCQSDHLRRSPASAGGRGGHKEWTHFCVLGAELDLLVNLSLMDGVQTGASASTEVPRLAVLVRDARGWDGDVERFSPGECRYSGGRIDLRMGPNELRFADGAYELVVQSRSRPLEARLRLTPLVTPAMTSSVPLGAGGSVRWLVVPYLLADGEVHWAGRRYRFRGAPAYHDHNWGTFQWGADFSWEWAVAVPPDPSVPWSLIFTRLSDRGRLRVFSEGLLLWKRDTHHRTFRGSDVEVRSTGFLRSTGVLRIPRVMGLAAPGRAADVPRLLEVRARDGDDTLDLELRPTGFAQIAIPSDANERGVTVLSEVRATARARGRVRGEPVELEGPALLELIHVAR